MAILDYIIWNGSPEIFTIPIPFRDINITLRWYGLLFALGFLISQQILYYMFRKEGKPERDVDTITIFMVVATIIGARLGHVLFYEPERYLQNPIDILKVWEGGLASHGAAIAILIALYLYANYFISFYKTDVDLKEKKGKEGDVEKKVKYGFFFHKRKQEGQSYFQVLDRIVILVALTGALIRLGNFFNSEIIGVPTNSNYGVVFARPVTESLKRNSGVEEISYVKIDSAETNAAGNKHVKVLLEFNPGVTEDDLNIYFRDRVTTLRLEPYYSEQVDQSAFIPYRIGTDEEGEPAGIIDLYMIPRHPAQLYESFSCLLLFIGLFWIWSRYKQDLPAGRLLGIFLIVCFGLRFIYEFVKENQVDFEKDLTLNMGQLLSIPLVIMGIIILIMSYKKQKV